MTKSADHLKRYADKYKVTKAADGIWQIQTTHAPKNGLAFDVYDYSDTLLAVLLPPVAAKYLLKRRPGLFTIHQDAGDGTVLLFDEKLLHDLAEDLKLRKKYNEGRIMSEEHRAKMKQFWFKSVSKTDQTA